MKTRSNMPSQHSFAQVPTTTIPRSSFDRSHGYKTTFDEDVLIPVYLDEVLPGDTHSCTMHNVSRMLSPLTHAVIDNAVLESFTFFVPTRLVWNNFQRFMGEQLDPDDDMDFEVPTMHSGVFGHLVHTNGDYFGLPTDIPLITHSSLPFRCLHLIWNEFFRDENLQDPLLVDKDEGPDSIGSYAALLPRGKRKDYFCGALPFPQKGDAVPLPLGTNAPVVAVSPLYPTFKMGGSGSAVAPFFPGGGGVNAEWSGTPDAGNAQWEATALEADLSAAQGTSINALRNALALQSLYEKDARGGTRYTELIKSHFQISSDDARLNRPEFLGGGSQPLQVNAVSQLSKTTGTGDELGHQSAHVTSQGSNHSWSKSFTEHGHVITLISVRADQTYSQGVDRHWLRETKLDYYWPSMAHLGEQQISNIEIYAQESPGNDAINAAAFGFIPRFDEYRYKVSKITGQLRSTYAQTLDGWTLSEEFTSLPTLSAAFIQANAPFERIVATPTYPRFLFDAHFKLNSVRPMPTYGVPGQMGRF